MIGCVLRVAVLLLLRETSALHVEEILYTGDTIQNVSLGYSVSVDGDIAIVGAPEFESRLGAAYIFSPIHKVDSPVRWSATARLTPATSMEGFGSQVSLRRLARTYAERGFISRYFQVRIHGSVCAVTCAMDFEIGKPSVHIYEAEGDVGWQWRARLTPSCDPACADDGVAGLPLCWPVAALESTLRVQGSSWHSMPTLPLSHRARARRPGARCSFSSGGMGSGRKPRPSISNLSSVGSTQVRTHRGAKGTIPHCPWTGPTHGCG